MPRLFDDIVLLVDCPSIGSPAACGDQRIVPRGSRGVLVDRNETFPCVWTIEFPDQGASGGVLVEADESAFVVRVREQPADRVG